MSKRNLYSGTGWRWTGYKKKKCCEHCRKIKKRLVVHHKDRDISNNLDHSNLETLCRACHAVEHTEEISVRQRDPEVNRRRGAAISKARTGKHYPKTSLSVKNIWRSPIGAKLRASRKTASFRLHCRIRMKKLMNDPVHMEKRRRMKKVRLASS